MKGFVPTPDAVVDLMVDKLFANRPPNASSSVLDPGCGPGAFIAGILRWCDRTGTSVPRVTGVDSDLTHVVEARRRFAAHPQIRVLHGDFLEPGPSSFDFIVGNPPYVPITGLTVEERGLYRRHFSSASGRFDLYLLFFEQAMRLLRPNGRLVFITPEKYLYVGTASRLRELMSRRAVTELHFADEGTFGNLVTYPLITTVEQTVPRPVTSVFMRDGTQRQVRIPSGIGSWLPAVLGARHRHGAVELAAVCDRISCGVATGADQIFVVREAHLPDVLRPFAYATIAGRELRDGREPTPRDVMLVPYAPDGSLLPDNALGSLGTYLEEPGRRTALLARTCVARKPWYAFHETPQLPAMLRPKILCKDIGPEPRFYLDRAGTLVPRHSVYYLTPAEPEHLDELFAYVSSPPAQRWLIEHCQRAANGFIRMQSHVLKRMPLPSDLAGRLGAAPLFAVAVG